MNFRFIPILLCLLAMPAWGSVSSDWGVLGARDEDVQGDRRIRVLGPVFESVTTADGVRFWAFRPFYSSAFDPAARRGTDYLLWPAGTFSHLRDEDYYRFLLMLYLDYNRNDPLSRYHFWFVPIYFQGRDAQTNNYLAVFPIAGTIRDFILRDEVSFFLFPLTAKSSIHDITTHDVLWPIFAWTRGRDTRGGKVFPLWGYYNQRGLYEKGFVCWPFYTWLTSHEKKTEGHAYIVFPLWGRMNYAHEQTWMFLPPFFRFTRGERQNITYCPWPFFIKMSGSINKFYIFPLWGRKKVGPAHSAFVLWPFIRMSGSEREKDRLNRFSLFPVYRSEIRQQKDVETGQPTNVTARYHQVWPLGSYRREGDARRFRTLDLWPIKSTVAVERNYAPLWTLYTHTANGDAAQDELLWGLAKYHRKGATYRHTSLFPFYERTRNDDAPQPVREWSVLKGLLGYRQTGTQKTVRMLYLLRFSFKEKKP